MKRFSSLSIYCLLVTAVGFFAPAADAALIVRFDSSTYQASVGATVDVTVQLEVTDETDTFGPDHTVLLSDGGANGLFSIGVFVMNDNLASATSNGADVLTIADVNVNDIDFDDTDLVGLTVVGPGMAGVRAVSSDFVEGVQIGATGPFIVDIVTLTYTLGSTVGEETTLTLGDFVGGFDDTIDTVFPDTNVFDSIIDFSAVATITAVPEPSSAVFWAGLTMGCALRRRRTKTQN